MKKNEKNGFHPKTIGYLKESDPRYRKRLGQFFTVLVIRYDYFKSSKSSGYQNGRTNAYAFFVYLGLKLLKPNGYLAYVISSSMNNGTYFRKLRRNE